MRQALPLALALSAALFAAPKKPVYMGVRACAACHAARSMGNQYSAWLHSKHSRAWAVLARPEAREIVKLSGLRQEPQQAAICLGCHATAWHAEPWQRDEAFRIEDGVQCERCHGPGSEYMAADVMRDRKAAIAAGLKLPTVEDCVNCHTEKGSHTAVLHTPKIDVYARYEMLKHPLAKNPAPGPMPALPPPDEQAYGKKYGGVFACARCHTRQFSVWRMSAHAGAWAALGTPKGLQAAEKKGIADPQASPECLKCHATNYTGPRLASFSVDEGVGCEACHGAGSEQRPERESCLRCHDKTFDVEAGLKKIAHPLRLPPPPAEPRYKTPLNLALRPDGNELWVACEASDSVIVVDTARREKVAEIPVGNYPADVTFAPDGRRAFVSSRFDNTVSVIDVAARKVAGTLKAGDEPHGVLTDQDGRLLYVLNTSSNDISVFDAVSLKWIKNLSASRGPWSLARSPDGSRILATNMLSRFAPLREPFVSEVTSIETGRAMVDRRYVVPDANLMMGIDWHPSGKFALATLNRTKNLVPMTRLLQGWTITNGLAVIWADGGVDQVLLDEPDLGFADATDVACTRDGRYALVTSAGSDRVAVIDIEKLLALLRRSSKYEREHVLPNHLGKSAEFIVKYIAVKNSPRGILAARDVAYVANALDDSISVIDLAKLEAVARIDLGGPRVITKARYGERLFNSANISFHHQFACHSCHPDGHVDGLAYDIEADGIGISPVDNRTLRGILDTAPFKWEGTNPSLSRQCGPRLAVFFTRLAPFTPEQLAAVDYYVTTIQRPLNRFRKLGAPLTPAQRRGKEIFEREETADGRPIPVQLRCVNCHFPPYYTDRRLHDVGTKQPLDRSSRFDTPHLNNIYDSAPYLHNGMAHTLEEIWTVHNPEDRHGVTNDLTKDQLNDLIEFLKTL